MAASAGYQVTLRLWDMLISLLEKWVQFQFQFLLGVAQVEWIKICKPGPFEAEVELIKKVNVPQVIYNPITGMGFLSMFTF